MFCSVKTVIVNANIKKYCSCQCKRLFLNYDLLVESARKNEYYAAYEMKKHF